MEENKKPLTHWKLLFLAPALHRPLSHLTRCSVSLPVIALFSLKRQSAGDAGAKLDCPHCLKHALSLSLSHSLSLSLSCAPDHTLICLSRPCFWLFSSSSQVLCSLHHECGLHFHGGSQRMEEVNRRYIWEIGGIFWLGTEYQTWRSEERGLTLCE